MSKVIDSIIGHALGDGKDIDGTLKFKDAVITNTPEYLCGSLTRNQGLKAIKNIYYNIRRTTDRKEFNLYFSGKRAVVVKYTNNGVVITGGDKLNCTGSTCGGIGTAHDAVRLLANGKCEKVEHIVR